MSEVQEVEESTGGGVGIYSRVKKGKLYATLCKLSASYDAVACRTVFSSNNSK